MRGLRFPPPRPPWGQHRATALRPAWPARPSQRFPLTAASRTKRTNRGIGKKARHRASSLLQHKTRDGVAFAGQKLIPHGPGGQESCVIMVQFWWESSPGLQATDFRPYRAALDVERGSSQGSLFSKDTHSIHEASTLMTRSPAKAPPPNTSPSEVRMSAREFRLEYHIRVWVGQRHSVSCLGDQLGG